MTANRIVEAEANSNIALIKYWGKLDRSGNYPAVPSLSLTLAGLRTATRIELDASLASDEILLDGEAIGGRPRERVVRVLDEFRRMSNNQSRVRVESRNDFPTAAGLASSASGFAALVAAANAAFDAALDLEAQSAMARAASASAARSFFGGWSILPVGAEAASQLAAEDHWPLVLLVAVTASGKKPIGSTEAMNLTRNTSPYYDAWVREAPALFSEACAAVHDRNLEALGAVMEQSTLMMHATMLAARPAVVYLAPGTLNVMKGVAALRASGTACYYTMDAGPHVKVLCEATSADYVRHALARVDGVLEVFIAKPGPGARVRTLT